MKSGVLQISVGLLLLTSTLRALALSSIGYQLWTVENGLPQNEVRGVTQTPDGFLWVATMSGLVRFDGLRFSIYTKGNVSAIASNRFTALERSSDGDLWVTYESGGILRVHQGQFRTYNEANGIPSSRVSAVTADDRGNVWILSGGEIAQWNPHIDRFELRSDLNKRTYGPLVWQSSGFVAYDREYVYTFSKGQSSTYRLPDRVRGQVILRVGIDQDRTAWLTMQSGRVMCLAAGNPSRSQELSSRKLYYHRGLDGQLWNFEPGLDFMELIGSASGKAIEISFRNAYADDQGNLWLATEQGLYRVQNQAISMYSVEQGLQDRDVYAIYQDRAGAVWLGVWHKGLSRISNGEIENLTVADGLPDPLVSSLFQDDKGQLWVGSHGGLSIYARGHFSQAGVPHLADDVVQAIFQDRAGVLWFGTRKGVSRLESKILQPFRFTEETAPRDVHAITQTSDGDLWFGGRHGLTQLHEGRSIRWSEANGLGSDDVWSLYAEPDGTLWVGTYDGGLARLKGQHITRYTTDNGLFSEGVFQILDDGLGNLWMSCDRGIYRTSKKELNEFADGERNSITSIPFGRADGLLTVEANGGVSPAGTRTTDGKLWFPTQDGAAVVDPRKVRLESHTPRVAVETAMVDQWSAPVDKPIRISPSQYNLQIQYTAPDFVRPDQLRFRYKLENLDRDWSEVGSRRTAFYTHLPSGHYRFIVSAKNENGIWSPPSEPILIDVLAPYYKTGWFQTLLAAGTLLLLLLAWRYRVDELKAKQRLQLDFLQRMITSQEEERKRIALELHDSLGQRLVVINSIAKLARRVENDQHRRKSDAFDEITSEATAGLEDTRSIAYGLRPSYLDRLGLTQSIAYLVQKASLASNMIITAELENIDDLVAPERWINLYRIVQEAVGNIIKYSSASKASVRIARNTAQAVLTIQDDGVGFELDGNLNKTGNVGLGLRGMAERCSLLGSEFSISSAPGQGTVITVRIKS